MMQIMNFSTNVVTGNNVGTPFGVSTANLQPETEFILEEGVFLVTADTTFGKYNGLLHFGARKTFGQSKTMELHLLGFENDLYGTKVDVFVLKFMRKVQKFANADALFTQIEKDIVLARKFFLRRDVKMIWSETSVKKRQKMAEKAVSWVKKQDWFKTAEVLAGFMPFKDEIPFIPLLMQDFPEKKWILPVWNEKTMHFEDNSGEKHTPEVIFCPAVAVDAKNRRLGRGGGVYDRYLHEFKGKTILILPDFAFFEEIPYEVHDVPMDVVKIEKKDEKIS